MFSLVSLFGDLLAGRHTQDDPGNYELWMMEPLPTWIPDRATRAEKKLLLCEAMEIWVYILEKFVLP